MYHKAKKSLGQNFLKSEKILEKITKAGNLNSSDLVLEIGPGRGTLTKAILKSRAHVIAVEKDDMLFITLKDNFKKELKAKKLEIIHGDILEFSPEKFLKNKQYKVIANIPYYITGEIIRKFLETEKTPKEMVLLIQKEVAERIVAKDKKESILSISVKAYGEPKIVGSISRKYFNPIPNVDSCILKISNISKKLFEENKIKEEVFFEIVKKGFSMKRKTLKNNLRDIPEEVFLKSKIDPKKRAEKLSVKEWFDLIKIFKR